MPIDLNTMGTQATGGALGLALGAVGGTLQNMQQESLMKSQLQNQQSLSAWNEQLQEKLWRNTGPAAMVPQLEQAGLNPALVYGMGGGGGGSTALAQGNLTGGQAQNNAGLGIQMAAQLGLMEAQKQNIEADTANKQADTLNKPKVGANIDVNTAMQQAQTKFQQIQNNVAAATQEDQIKNIQETADQAVTTADILSTQLSLDRQTKEEKVSLLYAQTAETLVRAALGKSGMQVNEQTIQKMKVDMTNAIKTTDQNERQLQINALKTDFEMNHPGIWNVIGGAIQGAAQKLGQKMGDAIPTTAEGAAKHKQ